jgi:hypothetical protein
MRGFMRLQANRRLVVCAVVVAFLSLSGCGVATGGSNDSTVSSTQVHRSGTAINLNIKATVTQRDNGRTVSLHVGDGIAVGFTGTFCGISIDPPDMLAFYAIPTPSNWLYLRAVKRGRGSLVARDSCKDQYRVTIVVS